MSCLLSTTNIATKAVAVYQRKGQDFSEEANSHFVKACIRVNQPALAVTEFSTYKSRIGSWTTPTSLHRLIESLETSGETITIVDTLPVLIAKGVKVRKESLEIVFKSVVSCGEEEKYKKVVDVAVHALGDEEGRRLASEFQFVKPVEEVAASAESEVVAGDLSEAVAEVVDGKGGDVVLEAKCNEETMSVGVEAVVESTPVAAVATTVEEVASTATAESVVVAADVSKGSDTTADGTAKI